MTHDFTLNSQLANDTHCLTEMKHFYILLHKNASIPWIIIVPKTHVIEIYDLSADMQKSINNMSKSIATLFKNELSIQKMNIAAIGNVVSQLHIHVIGRKPGDACWPDVVWGNDYAFKDYSIEQIKQLKLQITEIIINI